MCNTCNTNASSDVEKLRSFLRSDERFTRARSVGAIQSHLGWDGNRLLAALVEGDFESFKSVQRPGVVLVAVPD